MLRKVLGHRAWKGLAFSSLLLQSAERSQGEIRGHNQGLIGVSAQTASENLKKGWPEYADQTMLFADAVKLAMETCVAAMFPVQGFEDKAFIRVQEMLDQVKSTLGSALPRSKRAAKPSEAHMGLNGEYPYVPKSVSDRLGLDLHRFWSIAKDSLGDEYYKKPDRMLAFILNYRYVRDATRALCLGGVKVVEVMTPGDDFDAFNIKLNQIITAGLPKAAGAGSSGSTGTLDESGAGDGGAGSSMEKQFCLGASEELNQLIPSLPDFNMCPVGTDLLLHLKKEIDGAGDDNARIPLALLHHLAVSLDAFAPSAAEIRTMTTALGDSLKDIFVEDDGKPVGTKILNLLNANKHLLPTGGDIIKFMGTDEGKEVLGSIADLGSEVASSLGNAMSGVFA